MPDVTTEHAIRVSAMSWLTARTSDGAESISTFDLQDFTFEGRRVALKDRQQGIYKPSGWRAALSMSTVYRADESQRPYKDDVGKDGFLRYKWRGDDGSHYANKSLRQAHRDRDPLIWFFGTGPGMWKPIYPVYILGEEPEQKQFIVDPDVAAMLPGSASPFEEVFREYVITQVRARLHQPLFRAKIMRAYATRCAICALAHGELLDAAHIIPDGEERGDPVIANGLALCKIHHAAFDRRILGISPDYKVAIRRDLLEEIDGPMLRHGLQELHETQLRVVPVKRNERPDRDRLDWAYSKFLSAS